MAILGGIDEAGLGPLLGPLTLGWSVLRVPSAEVDPWQLLSDCVSPTVAGAARRVVVADSKKVHARNPRGRARLERTALTFLAQLPRSEPDGAGEDVPRDARRFLFGPLRPHDELVARHPWYAHLDPLPRHQSAESLELAAAALGRGLGAADVSVLDAGVRVVPAGELNASYRETDNKSETVWQRTLEVLRHLWTEHGTEGPLVTVDLQGARQTYGGPLARGFPEAQVTRLEERPRFAVYRLDETRAGADVWRPRRMDLVFREKGDVHSFPVALASCLAKYAREIAMEGFNAYFAAAAPDLRPTAGYTTDGRRWLEDARAVLEGGDLPHDVLVRDR